MRTSNHANIILWVYVRFTFKWNVDCCWCMDYILIMWREYVRQLLTRCVSSTRKNLLLFWACKSRVVTRNPNWSQRSGTKTGCVNGSAIIDFPFKKIIQNPLHFLINFLHIYMESTHVLNLFKTRLLEFSIL